MADKNDEIQPASSPKGRLWCRLAAAFVLALTLALSAYLLINMSKANNNGFASLWFLAVLPAFLSALICYIGDPGRNRSVAFYWLVPLVMVILVDIGSAFFLREGVVCLLMLSPIWLIGGWIGAFILRSQRKRPFDPDVFRSTLLGLPLLLGLVESHIPFAAQDVILTRQILIHASTAEVWPYAVSNAHIDAREGQWTFSQNMVGLPRPRATVMHGHGIGAVRTAYWGDHISFDEHITQWLPGKQLAWTFSFSNNSLQTYTDQHISPDGPFLKIDSGDYTLEAINPDTTRLTLHTRYRARTHVNLYAAMWGEVLLGDIENNILAIIKQRAERTHIRDLNDASIP